MKQVAILGATGSIGDSTLAVIRRHPEMFNIYTLSGHKNAEKLIQLALEFNPKHVVVTDSDSYKTVKQHLSSLRIQVHFGTDALTAVVADAALDIVVAGIVGNAGMASVLSAVQAGKTLLLANKESIVAAGELVMPLAVKTGAKIIPLDSEHNAIFQCLGTEYITGIRPKDVKTITLTASGGPFWQTEIDQFSSITPAQAVAHPKWDMGAKISVDSATLMNKGLEVIEAHWLFQMPNEDINVVVHPQSIIHSMVNFIDGSVLSQMGCPDMQIPIAHGLSTTLDTTISTGKRLVNDAGFLDLIEENQLTFYAADLNKFHCLQLARNAIIAGGTAPAILNAVNEETVAAFLVGKIRFDQIASFNDRMLNDITSTSVESLLQLQILDQEVRQATITCIDSHNK